MPLIMGRKNILYEVSQVAVLYMTIAIKNQMNTCVTDT